MNLIFTHLIIIHVCIYVTCEEITTKTDTTTSAKVTDTVIKPDDINTKETTLNVDEAKKPSIGAKQGQFDMKDFKVTKLKSHHFEDEETEICLANLDPKKIEAVKKSIRIHDGKIENLPDDPSHVEEQKIANCLKKEKGTTANQKNDQEATSKNENVTTKNSGPKINTIVEDAKVTAKNNEKATSENNNEKLTTLKLDAENINTVEEDTTQNKGDQKKHGRRDTEYQFDALEYYDDQMVFDNTTCPDKVDIIELELSEVKNYDLECAMITHWTGLADTEQMVDVH